MPSVFICDVCGKQSQGEYFKEKLYRAPDRWFTGAVYREMPMGTIACSMKCKYDIEDRNKAPSSNG